jgi:hypothetical protein
MLYISICDGEVRFHYINMKTQLQINKNITFEKLSLIKMV